MSSRVNPVRIAIGVVTVSTLVYLGLWQAGVFHESRATPQIDSLYETSPSGATEVLFIGNSHVFNNDVPGLFQRVAASQGKKVWVEQTVRGGAPLDWHWTKGNARQKIVSRDFDFVVLQEQSGTQALDPRAHSRSARRFVDLIDRATDAEPVFFQQWPWDWGHPAYENPRADVSSPKDMLERTQRTMKTLSNYGRVAPIGEAWWAVMQDSGRDIQLHYSDGNHAKMAGAYLTAWVLYAAIFGDVSELQATEIYRPETLSPESAVYLARQANRVVSESVGAKAAE